MSMHGDPLMEPENRDTFPDRPAADDTAAGATTGGTTGGTGEDPTGHAQAVADTGEDVGHGQCPHCGTEMVTGTIDFAGTPDETAELDVERATLQPGQMVTAAICPNPECPGQEPDTGARL